MIQNPFHKAINETEQSRQDFFLDIFGTSLALLASILAAVVAISIRTITTYAKLHFMVVPMGWVLGNLILCPIFLMVKIALDPKDDGNNLGKIVDDPSLQGAVITE